MICVFIERCHVLKAFDSILSSGDFFPFFIDRVPFLFFLVEKMDDFFSLRESKLLKSLKLSSWRNLNPSKSTGNKFGNTFGEIENRVSSFIFLFFFFYARCRIHAGVQFRLARQPRINFISPLIILARQSPFPSLSFFHPWSVHRPPACDTRATPITITYLLLFSSYFHSCDFHSPSGRLI